MVLVGHSMGGDVIVEAARRLEGRVAGLVWVDTYRTLGGPQSSPEDVQAFVAPFRADFAAAARQFVRQMFLATSEPGLVDWVVEDMAAAPPEIAVPALERAITFEPAIVAALPDLGVPWSRSIPTTGRATSRRWPATAWRPSCMPGVAHFLMLEDPATFNRLLETTIRRFVPASGVGARRRARLRRRFRPGRGPPRPGP